MLARAFARCVVITVNDDLTTEKVRNTLGVQDAELEICPYSENDLVAWKVAMCRKHSVALMVDDDSDVIRQCEAAGMRGLLVGFAEWKE